MVDYQGPAFAQTWLEHWELPLFDRITRIEHSYRDLGRIPLERDMTAKLLELEQISVHKRGRVVVDERDVQTVEQRVPPCRLAALNQSKDAIDVYVTNAFSLGCAAP